MGRMINTVCGPVSTDDFGAVLVHEHIVFGYPGYEGDLTIGAFKKDEYLETIMGRLDAVKKHGVKTIVDATPNECGRNVRFLKEVSEKSGVNIICCTGYYFEHEGGSSYFNFRKLFFDVETEVYDMMKTELYDGVEGTGIKAGVIKLASGQDKITDYEMIFFNAAAKIAAADKDVRIITHTTNGTCGLEQVELLTAAGVRPGQIQIGHFCGITDHEVQKKILSKGVYAGFDRIGLDGIIGFPKDETRFKSIAAMVEAGYGDKILLSHDTSDLNLGRPLVLPEAVLPMLKNWKLTHIFENVPSELQKLGVSKEQCDLFVTKNPADFYEGKEVC